MQETLHRGRLCLSQSSVTYYGPAPHVPYYTIFLVTFPASSSEVIAQTLRANRQLTDTDLAGSTTQFSYDALGRLLKTGKPFACLRFECAREEGSGTREKKISIIEKFV